MQYPADYFKHKLGEYKEQAKIVKAKIRSTSILRIIVFVVTLFTVYLTTYVNILSVFASLSGGIALFAVLVKMHLNLYKKKQWFEALIKVNEEEISILKMEAKAENSGVEFIDDNHAFTSDLDVFGGKSIFRLINRTSTLGGKNRLAATLKKPIKKKELLVVRQKAIAELKDKNQWRQQFQAKGKLNNENHGELDALKDWAQQKTSGFNTSFYRSMIIVNPVLGIILMSLISFGIISSSFFLVFLLMPLFLLGSKLADINKQHALMSKKTKLLEKYSSLFKIVENEDFNSKLLLEIKNDLSSSEHSANHEIMLLSKIMSSFDYRLNMIVGLLLNVFFLWDIRQLIRLDEWKNQNSVKLTSWFENLALIDELNSFAGFNYAFQLKSIPVFSDSFVIDATNARHPFLLGGKNIGNPINICGWQQFNVITGANMAGKSTYLRTVGINLLLAMTGSAVVADSFVFKPVEIITGIKTSDSLQDGESYFFAELKRLKQIITRLENGEKLFIILDEILRGTNSADKQKGSLGLLKQLIRLKASGIIATHDLALGKLIGDFPKNIKNKRFEVEITNNELVFDYKIKDGVSQNLNATFLMKKMGITPED
jgi:hypothetical protein